MQTNEKQVWIKVCGLARLQDIEACANAGVDALGFLLAKNPADKLNFDQLLVEHAQKLLKYVPAHLERVVLSHSLSGVALVNLCRSLPLDTIQLQGEIPYAEAKKLRSECPNVRILRRIPIAIGHSEHTLRSYVCELVNCDFFDAFILDTVAAGRSGTGKPHDWSLSQSIVQTFPTSRFILAGGLTPGNVAKAINIVQPRGVDVMSGVSKARGIKDIDHVRSFVAAVRNCAR